MQALGRPHEQAMFFVRAQSSVYRYVTLGGPLFFAHVIGVSVDTLFSCSGHHEPIRQSCSISGGVGGMY